MTAWSKPSSQKKEAASESSYQFEPVESFLVAKASGSFKLGVAGSIEKSRDLRGLPKKAAVPRTSIEF